MPRRHQTPSQPDIAMIDPRAWQHDAKSGRCSTEPNALERDMLDLTGLCPEIVRVKDQSAVPTDVPAWWPGY